MGVTRWLDRIDPDVWQEAVRRVQSPPSTSGEVTAFLAAFGKKPEDWVLEQFEDLEDDPTLRSIALNSVFELAVTAESWDLDKAFPLGFESLPRMLPALEPLRLIFDFKGVDTPLPSICDRTDSGLFGCMSAAKTRTCLAAISSYPSIQTVCAALRDVKPSGLGRLLGGRMGAAALATKLESDYFAVHWSSLVAALTETGRRGHLLGFGLSS